MNAPTQRAFVAALCSLLTACATPPPPISSLDQQLKQATAVCNGPQFLSRAARMECYDKAERAVLEKVAPILLEPFDRHSNKRRIIAAAADSINQVNIDASVKLNAAGKLFTAKLKSIEPESSKIDSQMSIENRSLKLSEACAQTRKEDLFNCRHQLLRPIWVRNSPLTVSGFDQAFKDFIAAGIEYDNTISSADLEKSRIYYSNNLQQLNQEWRLSALNAIENAKQNNDAQTREALRDIGEIVRVIAEVSLIVAAGAAQANQSSSYAPMPALAPIPAPAPSTKIRCTSSTAGIMTYTNCN